MSFLKIFSIKQVIELMVLGIIKVYYVFFYLFFLQKFLLLILKNLKLVFDHIKPHEAGHGSECLIISIRVH